RLASLVLPYAACHRVLRSFPTRRSSDLLVVGREPGELVVRDVEGGVLHAERLEDGLLQVLIERLAADLLDEGAADIGGKRVHPRSEEHTSELQSLRHLVCRLLLEKKKHN